MGRLGLWFFAVVAFACTAGRCCAQPIGLPGAAPGRPAVSPYLNLTNRNIDPAVTYSGIVRPQFATNSALRALQQQVAPGALPAEGLPAVDSSLPVTGQPAYFLNTGGYFLNSRTGGAPPMTATRTTRPTPFTPPAAPRPQVR
jgi:hypothetical protein